MDSSSAPVFCRILCEWTRHDQLWWWSGVLSIAILVGGQSNQDKDWVCVNRLLGCFHGSFEEHCWWGELKWSDDSFDVRSRTCWKNPTLGDTREQKERGVHPQDEEVTEDMAGIQSGREYGSEEFSESGHRCTREGMEKEGGTAGTCRGLMDT